MGYKGKRHVRKIGGGGRAVALFANPYYPPLPTKPLGCIRCLRIFQTIPGIRICPACKGGANRGIDFNPNEKESEIEDS